MFLARHFGSARPGFPPSPDRPSRRVTAAGRALAPVMSFRDTTSAGLRDRRRDEMSLDEIERVVI